MTIASYVSAIFAFVYLRYCFTASSPCASLRTDTLLHQTHAERSASTFYPDYVYKIHARYCRTREGKIVYANIKYAIRLSGNDFRDSKMK